jgi:hypothetical protein
MASAVLVAGCSATPPTATPGPAPTQAVSGPSIPAGTPAVSTFEMTLPAPPQAPTGPPPTVRPITVPPSAIGELAPFREPSGRFAIDVPPGWSPRPQQVANVGDIKSAYVFGDAQTGGLVTVTQFDNGKVPEAFGATVNGVLKLTGLTERPGFHELAREQVPDRPDSALRVEVLYGRDNGMSMHSMVLFQLDGTVFSMVHAGVEEHSWDGNEETIRQILRSYTASPPAPTP